MPRNETPRIVSCVICDKKGYSDEMGTRNGLRMCGKCIIQHINWNKS